MRTSTLRRLSSLQSLWRGGFANLRVRLLLLVLLAIIPTLGLILYTAMEQRHAATLAAQEDALRLVRLAAIEQAQMIDEAHQLLTVLAQLPSIRNRDAAACSDFIAGLLQQFPQYESIGVVDPNGDIFCSAIPADQRRNMADRPYFPAMFQATEFTVGEYLTPRSTGRPVLCGLTSKSKT